MSETEGAEKLGDLLQRAVIRPARQKRSLAARAKRKWSEVAGEDTARHSWPRGVRRGVLTVEVDSSALLAELAGYRSAGLLTAINEGRDAVGVRQIRFVLAEDQS